MDQLDQWEALFVGRLIDAGVDQVFVQCGATPMQRGSTGFLLIDLLLFLCLLLCLNILIKDKQKLINWKVKAKKQIKLNKNNLVYIRFG